MQTTTAPGRPTTGQPPGPVQSTAPAPSTLPAPDQPPAAQKLVEVLMVKKYCPHYLVHGDDVVPNDAQVKENVMPGIVRLHPKDAQIALGSQAATPTHNTFKDL